VIAASIVTAQEDFLDGRNLESDGLQRVLQNRCNCKKSCFTEFMVCANVLCCKNIWYCYFKKEKIKQCIFSFNLEYKACDIMIKYMACHCSSRWQTF